MLGSICNVFIGPHLPHSSNSHRQKEISVRLYTQVGKQFTSYYCYTILIRSKLKETEIHLNRLTMKEKKITPFSIEEGFYEEIGNADTVTTFKAIQPRAPHTSTATPEYDYVGVSVIQSKERYKISQCPAYKISRATS